MGTTVAPPSCDSWAAHVGMFLPHEHLAGGRGRDEGRGFRAQVHPGERSVCGVHESFKPNLTNHSLSSFPPWPCPWGWVLQCNVAHGQATRNRKCCSYKRELSSPVLGNGERKANKPGLTEGLQGFPDNRAQGSENLVGLIFSILAGEDNCKDIPRHRIIDICLALE